MLVKIDREKLLAAGYSEARVAPLFPDAETQRWCEVDAWLETPLGTTCVRLVADRKWITLAQTSARSGTLTDVRQVDQFDAP